VLKSIEDSCEVIIRKTITAITGVITNIIFVGKKIFMQQLLLTKFTIIQSFRRRDLSVKQKNQFY
jgi:hypothetical protein